MPNHLAGETSPYLGQHADDPVDWYPWGDEAFRRARAEDKPVFLSIGYLSCHWCHVMARESFRDGEIAALINDGFIAVKVDREERPDLDSVYMEACRAFTAGGGGWPMTLFLTPEGRPFYGGSYFPKESRRGEPGLKELLIRVRDRWASERESLSRSAEKLAAALRSRAEDPAPVTGDDKLVQGCLWLALRSYDEEWGGFGDAPKFPMPQLLLFLLQQYALRGDGRLLQMAEGSLGAMADGGIFDQLGGGFCRYAVDRAWRVPHFEKMLSDNALLTLTYARAWELTGRERWLTTARRTADYVLRELTGPEGGFFSAQDADSEGLEGAYYLFTPRELKDLLGEREGEAFCVCFGISEPGSFAGGSVPCHAAPLTPEVEALLPRVLAYRKERRPLAADDKVLSGGNGLMIEALCTLYRLSREEKYLAAAERAWDFLDRNLREEDRLFVSYRAGKRGAPGCLGDYAGVLCGLLALWGATLKEKYLDVAEQLAERALAGFFDREAGGFYLYDDSGEALLLRPKESTDAAHPSGNSLMTRALLRLDFLRPSEARSAALEKQLAWQAARARLDPMGHAAFLAALSDQLDPPARLTVAARDPAALGELPFRLPSDMSPRLVSPPTAEYPLLEGKTAYYLCLGDRCLPPAAELDAAAFPAQRPGMSGEAGA